MKQSSAFKHQGVQLPLFVEKDEDEFYVVECPILEGCYAQGKTLDEALKNIHDVISLIAEEGKNNVIMPYGRYFARSLGIGSLRPKQ